MPMYLRPYMLFSTHDAVGLGDLALGVGGEAERQAVLFLELVVRGDAVARHADDDGAGLAEVRQRSRKPQACAVQPEVSSLG